ncbi:MAG: cell surface protein SprA [Bacteroidales bacterium]|nr:cell surface protein SprA [Bacteroidales bacterium]
MFNFLKYLLIGHLAFSVGTLSVFSDFNEFSTVDKIADHNFLALADTPDNPDTLPPLRFPIPAEQPGGETPTAKGMQGPEPQGTTTNVEYDPKTNQYILERRIGNYRLGGQPMSFEEFSQYDLQRSTQDYWKAKNAAKSGMNKSSINDLIPAFKFNQGDIFDQLLGGDLLDIKVDGSVELILGFVRTRRDDPAIDIRNQRKTELDFDAKIQLNLDAKIGNKFDFRLNHNTEAMFAFDNKLKLGYEGKEDDIIKNIQLGDVSFSLPTTLIHGAQSLFGVSAKLQFGNTFVTTVLSEQRSESKTVTVQGGAQTNQFQFKADEYEDDRHFFIGHYFRDNYNSAMSTLPIINSNINILKVEVWVTNIGAPVTNNRNIVAFADLGEADPKNLNNLNLLLPGVEAFPDDRSNKLLEHIDVSQIRNINNVASYFGSNTQLAEQFVLGRDYEKIENARRLNENEYTFNQRLGFISLNTRLASDQVLAIAYQYQKIGDDRIYQVGEFSDEGITDPNSLVVKLLKSSTLNTRSSLWKLMMKNIYNLNAFQVSQEDFRLNIVYAGDDQGIMTGFFKDGPKTGIPLIELFGLDRMDFQQNMEPDGVFDFIDGAAFTGGLIQASTGRIYMPYIEPFGEDLITIFGGDAAAAERYLFKELYENTRVEAQQFPTRNKYYFEGGFKSSSSSEISIGSMNIPPGSVRVMAGNTPLTEGVDYTVDYMLGRVRIINEGILNSGVPINISSENNSMFNIMTKRMMGFRVDHLYNKNLTFGATLMNLHQSPITQKVNFGEDPINNTIWGFDATYENESRFLTRMVDRIMPWQTSAATSRLNLYGEFAHFIPGHSRAIGRTGTIYIDDFEGSKSSFNLKDHLSWHLASTPQGQPNLFFESTLPTNNFDKLDVSRAHRFNVGKLSWYIIDRIFYDERNRPEGIDREDLSAPYAREVLVREIFPYRDLEASQNPRLSTLDLSFFPSERGPYNYDVNEFRWDGSNSVSTGGRRISSGINANGNLKDPQTRWGGIMRRIDNTDFESTNVEYIEFWLMDPFINPDYTRNMNSNGGKLYFNLGDVSEDVLRDGRKAFENGMPTTAFTENVDTTVWGRVPNLQSLVNAFDNDPNSRQFQDIGLDGLSSKLKPGQDLSDEYLFFFESFLQPLRNLYEEGLLSYDEFLKAAEDPSSDDFQHFLGSRWSGQTGSDKILERYKNFTNPDGNSPSSIQNTEDFSQQQTTRPNTEDINNDNTLNEAENYFQYEVTLRPDQMRVGQNYITDSTTARVRLANRTDVDVTWYQFKIPIRSPDRTVGQIQNFQSIRFMRMFLKDWYEDVVLRFGTLELVRSEWRKYNHQLFEDNIYITAPPNDQTEFDLTVVNIEENSNRSPIPYVIPPGIERQINYGTVNNVQMNEQALSMKVTNLVDGDARAIHKISDLDLRQFKYLRMFAHAEKVNEQDDIRDSCLVLFVRLGSDFKDNYYEYEVPLALTPWFSRSTQEIWPSANEIEINLEKMVDLKVSRNTKFRQTPGRGIDFTLPYSENIDGRKYTIVGSPSLSAVKTIMIGVRNPKKIRPGDDDDGKAKSAEVWINELRLTDFNQKTGFATTGRAQAFLGDLGNVNVSGSYTSANFGQLETRITELQQDNVFSVDISTNLELGKFLPPESGVKIPVHYDYSRSLNNPEYNPLDPDVRTSRDLRTYATDAERDEVKEKIQDVVVRQNINFMNVRKEYTNKDVKPQFYHIENFTASYSYSGMQARSVDIEYNNRDIHKGGLTYAYSIQNKPVTPFAKTALAKNKSWALLTDFNFNYLPKSFAFNTEIMREFNENKLRDKSPEHIQILVRPTYFKRFDWMRNYDLKWDFAKSLQFDYNASAIALIEEPTGKIDTREKRDSVWQSVFQLGTIRNFNQNANLVWTIPINKIPILDWLSASAGYGSTYRWEGSLNALASLGHTIENSNTQTIRTNADFVRLYNKIPFLRAINTPRRTTPARPQPARPGQAQQPQQQTSTSTWETLYKGFFRMVMGVRNASFEYRVTEGILLPGFTESPTILGTNFNSMMPGLPFVFGSTRDFRNQVARLRENQEQVDFLNYMSRDSLQNQPYMEKFNTSITATALFEPFVDFRIQFNAGLTSAETNSEFIKYDRHDEIFKSSAPQMRGNYNITTIAWKTAFVKDKANRENPTFETFLEYREIIANRLGENNPHSIGQVLDSNSGHWYPDGYGPTSQEVLIPAFIAAYLGKNPDHISLSAFPKIPIPNWNLTYNGLTRLDFFRKHFNRISLQHGYRANYTIGAYSRNMRSGLDEEGNPFERDMSDNIIGMDLFESIVISEQFSPLARVSVELKNNFQVNAEIRKSRNLGLSFTNNQLTESRTDEWIFGLGYIFKDVGFNVTSGQSQRNVKSDINVRAGVSIRSNVTMLRRIDQRINLVSAGTKITTLNFSADYQLAQNIVLRLFYDQTMNRPELPTMFYNSTTNGGISLKFTFNQ